MRRKSCYKKNVWDATTEEYQNCEPNIIKREKYPKEKLLFLIDVLTILDDMNIYIDEIAEELIENGEVNFSSWNYGDLKDGVKILKDLVENKY